jgi:phenol hydroxylase P1 protein
MNLDVKALILEARRQTFSHIARRQGADRPASRYDEATLDVQATDHFHYRPLWQPENEIYDTRRTAIRMSDWYKFKDPRQLYYATYNMSRANMIQSADRNFAFVEGRDMLAALAPTWRQKALEYLVPLRHYEWGANMNNQAITDWGYGTQITSASAFCGADRLGMAQLISRIGLALDGQTGESLERGRKLWLEAPYWQGLRRVLEDSFVVADWFEVFVAQNLAMDGIVHPLVFRRFDREGAARGGLALSLLCGFMIDWYDDNSRWVDAVVKAAAEENADNRDLLAGWFGHWRQSAAEAVGPLAAHVLDRQGEAAVEEVVSALRTRAAALGLEK